MTINVELDNITNYIVLALFSGVIANVGSGTGGLLAALIIESFNWRYYFYCMSAIYMLGLVSHLLFVQESPETSWFVLDLNRVCKQILKTDAG